MSDLIWRVIIIKIDSQYPIFGSDSAGTSPPPPVPRLIGHGTMPLGFGDGGFDAMLKKAAANAKVMARDVAKGGSNMMTKMSETDVKGSARRMTNKVLERAEGGNFSLVEEIPEVWPTVGSQGGSVYYERGTPVVGGGEVSQRAPSLPAQGGTAPASLAGG